MKAGRLTAYHRLPEVQDVPQPHASGPDDVVVRVAGAGVCRTDLHILDEVSPLQPPPKPPFTLGHENAGWIEEVGSSATGFRKGDPVILHPGRTCGLCEACRQGNDMYCPTIRFPGVDGSDGGYAEYLLTSVRSVVPLAPGTEPAPLAPFADAGITAYHAVKRIRSLTYPGCVTAVIGIGGLGHFGVQLLKAMTPSQVVAVDTEAERLDFAKRLGADYACSARDPDVVTQVERLTRGEGADIVLDFVAEDSTPDLGLKILRRGGTYSIVGYGGTVTNRTVDMIVRELRIQGNFVGSYRDLVELMELNRQGRVRISMKAYPLADVARAVQDLREGRILGRAVLCP